MMSGYVDLNELKGLSFSAIRGLEAGGYGVRFTLIDGRVFEMFHEQECCESVGIVDVCGDVDDLLNAKIVHFEERTSEAEQDEIYDDASGMWTFYDIQTTKGCVNIRWLGVSNGYYSEAVSIKWIKEQ